jgi:hypothetical protein
MRLRARWLTLLLCAPAGLPAQTTLLFNGTDLRGWHLDVPAIDTTPSRTPPFSVRNGLLVTSGEPRGHLITDASYRDYRLEVEYRFSGTPGNAGVLIHSSAPRALYGMFPQSLEVQMESGNAGDFWCIVEDVVVPNMVARRGPRSTWGITEGAARRVKRVGRNVERPVGQWNRIVVEAIGRRVIVWVNGVEVNRGTTVRADQGQIALQAEGSAVEFRRVALTSLAPPRTEAAASWPSAAQDSIDALDTFRENLAAIHSRDRARYLKTYVHTPRLLRHSPQQLESGYDGWSAITSNSWPDTLIVSEMRVAPIAPGVVYGYYRYIGVPTKTDTLTGVSTRVFVRTPTGMKITVTASWNDAALPAKKP